MKKTMLILTILLFITACASPPDSVKPVYVSPLKYVNYNCEQIKQEYVIITQKLNELHKKQGTNSSVDVLSFGVGIFFWPALILMVGGDNEIELAQLKGDYEAIESFVIKSDCSFADEVRTNKERRIREKKERDERIKNRGW